MSDTIRLTVLFLYTTQEQELQPDKLNGQIGYIIDFTLSNRICDIRNKRRASFVFVYVGLIVRSLSEF
jgi:hypothetical protein